MSLPQQNWQTKLENDGYAIIHGILTEDECKTMSDGFWSYFTRLTNGRLNKDDPTTYKALFDYFPIHGMLYQHYSIGHMQEIWDVRSHPKVVEIFRKIWNTDDLVVSFDGASFSLPPEVTNRGWHRKDWLHLDQSPHRSDLECIQSWVTAEDVGPGDGTLTVLKGSHLLHGQFAKQFGLDQDKKHRLDWLKLEPEHVQWYKDHGCEQTAVECPKGSMVLWDSRTVHAGRSPLKGRSVPRNRIVAYVSMMPASLLRNGERLKKQRACLEGRTTSHWAASRVKLFAKNPRTYGASLPAIPEYHPPRLTEDQARLAGWMDPSKCPLTLDDAEERRVAIAAALRAMDEEKQSKRKRV